MDLDHSTAGRKEEEGGRGGGGRGGGRGRRGEGEEGEGEEGEEEGREERREGKRGGKGREEKREKRTQNDTIVYICTLYINVCNRTLYVHASHPRQLIFSRKSDCLGCAVLLCLVCLFDLACFFLSSFLLISHLKTCIILKLVVV